MPAGRPLKFTSVEEIKPLINKYFAETPREEWTITGLALAMDTSRTTINEYCNKAERGEVDAEFLDTIKKAKEMVENGYEIDLKKHGRTGTIFALKNFDWKDKTEVDHTSGGERIGAYKELTDDELLRRVGETRVRALGEGSSAPQA